MRWMCRLVTPRGGTILAARGKNLLQDVTLMELETSFFYGHGAKEGS
jgi:hypothetical protein